jgi:acyl-CoA thioesterase I
MSRLFTCLLLSAIAFVAAHAAAPAADAAAPVAQQPTILVLGDSISAAYGIRVEQGWVALLQQKLKAQGYGYRVVNASVSGETTSGGAARLARALELHRPQVVILELGGNDGLRGLQLTEVRNNLEAMIRRTRAANARVVLVGMRIPPNYGPTYTREFQGLYSELARQHKLPLIPFFLERVVRNPAMMQEDGIHPSAPAQAVLVDTIWPALQPMLVRSTT